MDAGTQVRIPVKIYIKEKYTIVASYRRDGIDLKSSLAREHSHDTHVDEASDREHDSEI